MELLVCNSNTQEAEAGELLQLKASLDYIMNSRLAYSSE